MLNRPEHVTGPVASPGSMQSVVHILVTASCCLGWYIWAGSRPAMCQYRKHIPFTSAARIQTQRSSPGPKSRAKAVTLLSYRRAQFLLMMSHCIWPAQAGHLGDVRVDPSPAGGSRAFQAKPAGTQSIKTSGATNKGPKRAFLRAQSRARASPILGTWYRGRFHSAKQLGVPAANPMNQNKKIGQQAAIKDANAPRLRIITWNCGGLNQKYQEILQWLKDEHRQGRTVDIMAVQETGWREDMEFETATDSKQDPQLFVVHSGSGSSEGGVLYFISTRLARSEDIRTSVIHPGRALHLRSMLNPPLDVLNVYQYSWNPSKQGADQGQFKVDLLVKQRMNMWNHIRKWLGSIPRRNGCIVLGDFNTPLQPSPGMVGNGLAKTRDKPIQTDHEEFQNIVRNFSCCALNTWRQAGSQARTFLPVNAGEGHGTQIDFILCRGRMVDGIAKQAAAFISPIVPATGCRHLLVHCSVRKPRIPRNAHNPSVNKLSKYGNCYGILNWQLNTKFTRLLY